MAHIVPSISFMKDLRQRIHNGQSISQSLDQVCQKNTDKFTQQVRLWWAYHKLGKENRIHFKSDYQKTMIQILKRGLEGAPIYEHILLLEEEMLKEFERQWKAYLESLPFKLMIPLLLFFFPAYVILLFGPLFIQFLSEVSP